MKFNCLHLFKDGVASGGSSYAHEYDEYLNFFRMLGHAREQVVCDNVPMQWAPLILWLGHKVDTTLSNRFEQWSGTMAWDQAYALAGDKRRVVEVSSTLRPELVHALYCADTEWPCPLHKREVRVDFPVTCNGSFFRAEVQEFRALLRSYKPERRKAILVPCAADKPYPAAMHKAVAARRDSMPDAKDWEIIIATGVLGLIPETLWGQAPLYDSGLPNVDRVMQTVSWYFTRHKYERIVVYSDFYAYAIRLGLLCVARRPRAEFLFGYEYRDTYENTNLLEHLDRLEIALRSP